MQARVAVIGDRDLRTAGTMDEFLSWEPVRDVPRKGGRGLLLSTGGADSVDAARAVYALWQAKLAAIGADGAP